MRRVKFVMNAEANNGYYPSEYYYGDPRSYVDPRYYGDSNPYGDPRSYGDPRYYGDSNSYGDSRSHGDSSSMIAAPNFPVEHKPMPEKENRKQAVLNAASGGVGPLPVFTTLLAAPLNVVSTTINTKGIGKTNNLLKFTGIINLPLGISVTFNFQIHRVFNNGTPIGVGSTYTFATTVNVLESEAFSFQFFDADVQEGSYTYSVNLSTNSIVDVTPGATINAVLSVLAVAV